MWFFGGYIGIEANYQLLFVKLEGAHYHVVMEMTELLDFKWIHSILWEIDWKSYWIEELQTVRAG